MTAAMLPATMPTIILISGTGSNMQCLAQQAQRGELAIHIKAVISDRATAKGLQVAAEMGIPTATLDPKQFVERADFDTALAELAASYAPQLVVLAGFMRILSDRFLTRFADRMLNIHPSLLPKYRGLHTHQRAIEAGDHEHGASVHFVTEALDGGPLVMQGRVPVLRTDTPATLAARVLSIEHQIFPHSVQLFASGRLQSKQGKAWLDGQELIAPLQV